MAVNGKRARELNETIRYTTWSVFRAATPLAADRAAVAAEVEQLFEQLAAKDVVVRGTYDVSALRADADLMVWWHAPTADDLQEAYGRLRRTELGPVAGTGLVADGAAPAGRVQQEPRAGVPRRRGAARRTSASTRSSARTSGTCCRTRSAARCSPSTGRMARGYPDVRANTVASFALGDYEWILAFEADELHRIVDLMRRPARLGDPPARPRGDPVLHRPPPAGRRPRRRAALTGSGSSAADPVTGRGR